MNNDPAANTGNHADAVMISTTCCTSSLQQLLRPVVESNDRAVSLLMEGKYGEAKDLLNQALDTLKGIAVTVHQGVTMDVDDDCDVVDDDMMYIESVSVPCYTSDSSNSSCSYPGEVFVFFNRALVIHLVNFNHEGEGRRRGRSSFSSSPPVDIGIVASNHLIQRMAAVVLYNVALLHHLRGLSAAANERTPTADLTTALSLYRMALSVMSNTANTTASTSSSTCARDSDTILILSALNNMGHIHEYSFMNVPEASTCLDLISKVFGATEDAGVLNDDESLFFYTTLFLFPAPYSKPVAPAA